ARCSGRPGRSTCPSSPTTGASATETSAALARMPAALLVRARAGAPHLRVLRGQHARHADAADDLASHHDRDAALERGQSLDLEEPQAGAAARDHVLERLAGSLEVHRGRGLALGDVDARVLRVVEPMEHDEMSAAVD